MRTEGGYCRYRISVTTEVARLLAVHSPGAPVDGCGADVAHAFRLIVSAAAVIVIGAFVADRLPEAAGIRVYLITFLVAAATYLRPVPVFVGLIVVVVLGGLQAANIGLSQPTQKPTGAYFVAPVTTPGLSESQGIAE